MVCTNSQGRSWGGGEGEWETGPPSRTKRTNFKEHQTLRMNLVCVMKEGSFPVGNILLKMGSTLGVASTPVPAQRAVDSMLSGNQAVCATTSSAGATIAAKLLQQGLSDTAMRNARTSFHSTTLQPRRYADPPWLLKPNCIRVVALMLSDEGLSGRNGTRLANLAIRAGHELRAALPEGSQFWMPKAASLHATVFHPGGAPGMATGLDTRPPTPSALRYELSMMRRLAASMPSTVVFSVDRLVLSSSGVLLLLLAPESRLHSTQGNSSSTVAPCIESLRTTLAQVLPNATPKQTRGLVHVSLLRLLSLPPSLTAARRAEFTRTAATLCEQWSERMRGMRVTFRGVVYARETQIMTMEGAHTRLPFGHGRLERRGSLVRMRRERRRLESHAPDSLRDVLASGGTRPGYDHDHDRESAADSE